MHVGLRSAVAAGILLVGCGRAATGPNVLLITLDTTRADYISPLGADPGITPHLQALADRSSLFTQATCETNLTNPSHLTIMTGLRAIEHGVVSNEVPAPESMDTLVQALRRAGYRTAGFPAVTHVGPGMRWRGFDDLHPVGSVIRARTNTDRAIAWLRDHDGGAFFLWVHYFDPHAIYEPPADVATAFYQGVREAGDGPPIASSTFFDRSFAGPHLRTWLGDTRDPEYPRAMYAAEIHYTDREVGRLLADLEAKGYRDNTVVVVVADHGESLGEHEIYYDHIGIYEPQLRIPLIIHAPGFAATRSGAPVSTLDVAPTVSELTGTRLRHQVSGLSLVPLMRGEASAAVTDRSSMVYQHADNDAAAVRQGPWKLIWPINPAHEVLPGEPELYHLDDDPGELVNLAAAEPERLRDLARSLRPWIDLGVAEPAEATHLDDAAREQLKALGYLQD